MELTALWAIDAAVGRRGGMVFCGAADIVYSETVSENAIGNSGSHLPQRSVVLMRWLRHCPRSHAAIPFHCPANPSALPTRWPASLVGKSPTACGRLRAYDGAARQLPESRRTRRGPMGTPGRWGQRELFTGGLANGGVPLCVSMVSWSGPRGSSDSRPIFTGCRDFDYETVIWHFPTAATV